MERRLPDITKIQELTGWKPTRSLLETIGDVIAYEREAQANTR